MKQFPGVVLALTAAGAIPACALSHPHVHSIDGSWESALDRDLAVAAAHADAYFAQNGWPIQLRWAGVRGSTYTVERGVTGEPMRESVLLLYAFYYPAQHKCFLSDQDLYGEYTVRLAREHVGGGQYSAPAFIGFAPLAGDRPVGSEIDCSAIDAAHGGFHVPAAADAPVTPV